MVTTTVDESSEYHWNHSLRVHDLDAAKSTPSLSSPYGGDEGLESWEAYLTNYGRGDWCDGKEPPPQHPDLMWNADREVGESNEHPHSVRDYGKVGEWCATPIEVQDIFSRKGYFAAPLGPFEDERRRVCARFGLDIVTRRVALDNIVNMAKAHFDVPLVVISVVLGDREIFTSTAGWSDEENGPKYDPLQIPLESAICTHMMTKTNENCKNPCFVMDDAKKDWRFAKNPYVRDDGLVSFFASSNIYLPTSFAPGDESKPAKLPVGSLCLIDSNPREPFTPSDEIFLQGLAGIIAREIQFGFEQSRQEAVAQQTAFLGAYLRSSLVLPSCAAVVDDTDSTIPFQIAASELQRLTLADAVVILDLRLFSAPHAPSSLVENQRPPLLRTTSATSTNSAYSDGATKFRPSRHVSRTSISSARGIFSGLAPGAGSITVLGSTGYDWEAAVGKSAARAAVSQCLINFYADAVCEYDTSGIRSPLWEILPPNTSASLSTPIFDLDGVPGLLLVACSFTKYFRFEPSHRQFVENVGAISMGSLLRKRILEADRAKLAFVSQVSHELRTPLHAIGSQLELIRTITTAPFLKTIEPLLNVAEVSVLSLTEILDDTLIFAKMSNSPDDAHRSRRTKKVSLEKLAEDVIISCWARTTQHAAVFHDDNENVKIGGIGAGADVKVILDIEARLCGSLAVVDVGGLKRVLFNLIGNALKFTASGTIKVVLSIIPQADLSSSGSLQMVGIDIIDSGLGMTEDFIKEQLFIPFKQQDSFSSGAGLGVSICDNIVKRMNGSLHFVSSVGAGTKASVSIPLKLILPTETLPSGPISDPSARKVRVISDELEDLLDAGSFSDGAPTLIETPPEEKSISKVELVVQKRPVGLARDESEVRVLVVDDNFIARKILTKYLSAKGVTWYEAENGVDAVVSFKENSPNLVWSDIQMPQMDGLEATKLMRAYEEENDLPPATIVALSGLSDEDGSHESALVSGQISQWLTKGGPSLRILGEGLASLQAQLASNCTRAKTAQALEELARRIREGGEVPEDLLKSLSIS